MSEWASVTSGIPTAVPGNTAIVFASFSLVALELVVPSTLVRVRGQITWISDAGAAGETPSGAFGIAVVREPARVAGVASLPTPITDAAKDDWLCWEPLEAKFDIAGDPGMFDRKIIDCKAMRKINDGDAIVLMVENASAAAQGAKFNFNGRFLFLLH